VLVFLKQAHQDDDQHDYDYHGYHRTDDSSTTSHDLFSFS
jgi:hypothetical protein